MRATFIETRPFTEALADFLSEQTLARLQQMLMLNPDCGAVIPGCGGLRKIRTGDPKRGKGKRGGARVIYLHIPAARRFYLLDVYGKDEKEDLSASEKKQLKELAGRLKKEAIAAVQRSPREKK